MWLSHSTQHWSSPTSSTVCSFGNLSMKRTSNYDSCPEEGDQDDETLQGQDLKEAADVTWFVHLGEEKAEAWPRRSLQLSQGGAVERELLISCFWWPAIGHEEAEWSWVRGSSVWTLGKGSSLGGWSVTGTGFPRAWSQHQACWDSRSTWMTLSHMVQFQVVLKGEGSWSRWSLWVSSYLRYSIILWFWNS